MLQCQEQVKFVMSGFDEENSFTRFLVEILLYVSVGMRVFARQLGIIKFTYLSGTFILLCGIVCVAIILIKKEHFPKSVCFAITMTILALISDSRLIELDTIVSRGSRDLILWTSILLMACYVVRNNAAVIRFALFLSGCLFLSLFIGSTLSDVGGGTDFQRLTIKKDTVGTMFANANAIAQIAYSAAIVLLFASLRCRNSLKIICWICAIALSAVLLLTLSRQGLIVLSVGILFYFLAALKSRGGKIGLAIFVLIGIIATTICWQKIAVVKEGYEYRLKLPSERTEYWKTALSDMQGTLFWGKGVPNARTIRGIQPHNTFLWLHLAFGGICAWVYVCWVLWMVAKGWFLIRAHEISLQYKLEAVAMLLIFFLSQLTGVFAPANYGTILTTAIFERYIYVMASRKSLLRESR
jgi:hypothetical protein